MKIERIAAIFIGLVMIFSMVGYGMMNIVPTTDNKKIEIPTRITKPLTAKDKSLILRSGKVLIEDFYVAEPDTIDFNMVLDDFTEDFKNYVVLNIVSVKLENQTKLQMVYLVGADRAEVKQLDVNMTKDDLIDIFCDVSYVQPKECLLREI